MKRAYNLMVGERHGRKKSDQVGSAYPSEKKTALK